MTVAVVDRGRSEVMFVLLLLQGAAGVLGTLGMVVLSGSLWPAFLPLLGPLVQFTLAGLVVRGRRWAYRLVLIMELGFVAAFLLNGLFGVLAPEVDLTVTLTGLLTRLVLPFALAYLSIRELGRIRELNRTRELT